MSKLNGQTPIVGHKATRAEMVELFANPERHAKAISYELVRVSMDTLVSLAYGEHAEPPFYDVPYALASLAYDEIERRRSAMSRLLSDVPSLARALISQP